MHGIACTCSWRKHDRKGRFLLQTGAFNYFFKEYTITFVETWQDILTRTRKITKYNCMNFCRCSCQVFVKIFTSQFDSLLDWTFMTSSKRSELLLPRDRGHALWGGHWDCACTPCIATCNMFINMSYGICGMIYTTTFLIQYFFFVYIFQTQL